MTSSSSSPPYEKDHSYFKQILVLNEPDSWSSGLHSVVEEAGGILQGPPSDPEQDGPDHGGWPGGAKGGALC